MSFTEALTAALAGADRGDSAHGLAHVLQVWANVQAICAGEGVAASRALQGATWLHDLVALPKDHPERARSSRLSATAARPILARLGLGEDEIATAAHAIEAHSVSAGIPPETAEARILQDADRLDALGAVGVARLFTVGGALGRPLYDPLDPFATRRDLDDSRWSLDHFAQRILRLPERMQTGTGRRLAEARVARTRAYLADLAEELGAAPPLW